MEIRFKSKPSNIEQFLLSRKFDNDSRNKKRWYGDEVTIVEEQKEDCYVLNIMAVRGPAESGEGVLKSFKEIFKEHYKELILEDYSI